MKVEINRYSGKNGRLSLKIVAETPADRVVLREFALPMGDAPEGEASVYVDRSSNYGDAANLIDLGPAGISLSMPEKQG